MSGDILGLSLISKRLKLLQPIEMHSVSPTLSIPPLQHLRPARTGIVCRLCPNLLSVT